jgi:hypothetical protein
MMASSAIADGRGPARPNHRVSIMIGDGEHSKHEEVIRLEAEAEELETEARDLERAAHQAEEHAHELRDQAHRIEDEERREHGGEHHHDHHDAIVIIVVVNGTGVEMSVRRDERLSEIRARALKHTQNLAQPAEAWEFKNEGGDVLDENLTVGELGLEAGAELFLSPQAGKAGA